MKNKTILVLIILFWLPTMMVAQNTDLDTLFKKYHGQEDVSSISISMNAIEISMAEDEDDHFEELLDQVDKIKILNFKKRNNSIFFSDLKNELTKSITNEYKLLLDVIHEKENVRIYIVNGDDNQITEGLILANENHETNLIWVTGNMKLSDFMKSHENLRKLH